MDTFTLILGHPATRMTAGFAATVGGLRGILSGQQGRKPWTNVAIKTFSFLALIAGERAFTQPLAKLAQLPKMHAGLQALAATTLTVSSIGLLRYERGTDFTNTTNQGEARHSRVLGLVAGVPFSLMFLGGLYLVKLPLAGELAEKVATFGNRRIALAGLGGAALTWVGLYGSSQQSVRGVAFWGQFKDEHKWWDVASCLTVSLLAFGVYMGGRELVGISAKHFWNAIQASDRYKNLFATAVKVAA